MLQLYNVGMNEYNRDAHVIELPAGFPDGSTHAVVIDLLPDPLSREVGGKEEGVSQMIALVFGENNAKETARLVNLWRDQTKFKH